ncbi:hypothetical protein NDU88_004079 [Pleurodeles waltl]|uniref:Uncharacterized protein n=1 Tax=Pleurodeles waltl TaxID=8319 RepID=A0AAV7T767_PLEWA|nr:hypothetical protein NDU88_004079 [Pleurodeles waltl]
MLFTLFTYKQTLNEGMHDFKSFRLKTSHGQTSLKRTDTDETKKQAVLDIMTQESTQEVEECHPEHDMPILLGHSSKLSSLDLSCDEEKTSDNEVVDIRTQNQIIIQEIRDLMKPDNRSGGDVKIEVDRSTVVPEVVKRLADDEELMENMCKYISSSDSDSDFTWPRGKCEVTVQIPNKAEMWLAYPEAAYVCSMEEMCPTDEEDDFDESSVPCFPLSIILNRIRKLFERKNRKNENNADSDVQPSRERWWLFGGVNRVFPE